jgi:hypothetical protein
MSPNNVLPVVVLSVIALRFFGRVRRNIGRQPLQPKRLTGRIIIYAVLTVLLAAVSIILNPHLLIGLGGGLALGTLLALAGLRVTRFETVAEDRFYTPNPYFGGALSFLLLARVVYRLIVLSSISHNSTPPPALLQSSLTFFVFGLLAGYYIAYYIGVLERSRAASS